ncbi:MAG: type IV toxin-antitoxin system AbiEi family antitoxin domain-containing protein [Candidatus Diapherotrites archaeon]|nr:type IV toxin-antitoxin system AbiEi family antitoxin domain-containing protein [Candidatus Diapherotrites archaeon]
MVKRSLGEKEGRLVGGLSASGRTVFTTGEARDILGSKAAVDVILRNLTAKGWIERLERGKYVFLPLEAGVDKWSENPLYIVPNLITPYYVSYVTAMHFHGFTEQVPVVVAVAAVKQKKAVEFQGTRYEFITLSKHKFFGWEEIELKGGQTVNMASKEKTIVDCFDKPRHSLGVSECVKALHNARGEVSVKILVDYALRMRNKTLVKRLGYCMDVLGMTVPKKLLAVAKRDKKYVLLEPLAGSHGKADKKWKVIKNVSDESLLSFLEIR